MLQIRIPFRAVLLRDSEPKPIKSWKELREVCDVKYGGIFIEIERCRENIVFISGREAYIVTRSGVEEAEVVSVRRLGGGWMKCIRRKNSRTYLFCLQ